MLILEIDTAPSFETYAVLTVDGYTIHMPFHLCATITTVDLFDEEYEVEKWVMYHKGHRYDGTFEEIENIYNQLHA